MGDVMDLTGDGGVLKTIIKNAKAGAAAPTEDLPLVDVHYEGVLADTGEVFDTTHEDNTIFSFELGKGTVIKAWDIALRTMKVGEVAKITCKPDYAYGSAEVSLHPWYITRMVGQYCEAACATYADGGATLSIILASSNNYNCDILDILTRI